MSKQFDLNNLQADRTERVIAAATAAYHNAGSVPQEFWSSLAPPERIMALAVLQQLTDGYTVENPPKMERVLRAMTMAGFSEEKRHEDEAQQRE